MGFQLRQTILLWLTVGVAFSLACQMLAPTASPPSTVQSQPPPTAEATPTQALVQPPAPELTSEPMPIPVLTSTPAPTPVPAPTLEPAHVATTTPLPPSTPSPSPTPTQAPDASPTPAVEPTPTASLSPTIAPTAAPTPTSSPTPTPTPLPQLREPYRNERLGLAFSYPHDWTIDASDPTFIRLSPGSGRSVLLHSIMVGPIGLDALLAQFVDAFALVQELRQISTTALSGDAPGYHLSFEDTSVEEASRLVDVVIVAKGARLFVLSASAQGGPMDSHRAELEQLVNSFEITLSPASRPIDVNTPFEGILDAIGEGVTAIRGLPALSDLKRSFQSREAFINETQGGLLDEETRVEIEMLSDLCVVVDLCSPAGDLWKAFADLHALGVLGFYDTEDKSLTVVTSGDEPDLLSWLTYAHEYTHALQDRQFNLSLLLDREDDTFDESKAALALVEGDANLSEFLFYESLLPEQQATLRDSLQRKIEEFSMSEAATQAPRIIRETFGWEHDAGPQFVFRLYLKGGFDAVNDAYRAPPQSTEQIIHPDKYLAGEEPHSIELPDLRTVLGDDWQQRDVGVFGELLTQVYLGAFLSQDQAAAAAQGWGGDRYTLLKDTQGRLLLLLRHSWDTEKDAEEFYQAYLDLVSEKSQGRWDLVETGDGQRLWTGENISLFLAIEGPVTQMVIGPDLMTMQAILPEILPGQVRPETETPEPIPTFPVISPMSITMASSADVVSPASEFDVQIAVDPQDGGVSGVTVRIGYDPAFVRPVDVAPGPLLGDGPTQAGPFIDEMTGVVEYTATRVGVTQPPTQPGLFATVRFLVSKTAPIGEKTTLTIAGAKIADEDNQDVGEVSIGDGVELEIAP